MAKDDVDTGLYLVAMVGIVAVIGLVVLVMNSGSSATTATYDYEDSTYTDLAGQAVQPVTEPCIESDGGDDPYTKGYHTGTYPWGYAITGMGIPDVCRDNNNQPVDSCTNCKLMEYYCVDDPNDPKFEHLFWRFYAGIDCEDGAIVQQQTCTPEVITDTAITGVLNIQGVTINNNRIVWESSGPSNRIYMYDIPTGTESLIYSNIPASGLHPAITGDNIFWGYSSGIRFHDYGSGITTILASPDNHNLVSDADGNYAVWYSSSFGTDEEVYLYDINSNSTVQMTDNNENDDQPRISGDYMVWVKDYDIYLQDINTNSSTQLTNTGVPESYPDISGDYVIWKNQFEVYLHDLNAGTTVILDNLGYLSSQEPRISGDKVVWKTTVNPILLHDISTGVTTEIRDGSLVKDDVGIYNDYVVWTETDNGDEIIYLLDLSTC
jgi:hypothetical protein